MTEIKTADEKPRPRNIVVLSDGTGNSAAKLQKTNVWRVYEALDLSRDDQIAIYDDGVGTSSLRLLALLGGAFGWGLKRNVIDLYVFLCRNYRPGDRIFGFGFSRGAFTIRVLCGLIANQGLIVAPDGREATLERLALDAFRAYKRERYRSALGLERLFRPMRDGLIRMTRHMTGRTEAPLRPLGHQPGEVRIAFLGLWDSVAAYGLPIDELTRAWRALIPLSIPDRNPSAIIERACHALAIDDERQTFHPVLWNEAGEPDMNRSSRATAQERISQVWFAGSHSNVGGGHPEDGLSHVPLVWVLDEARRVGLHLTPGGLRHAARRADPFARLYPSRRGLSATYRYQPRKIALLTQDVDFEDDQVVIPRPKIHESVLERLATGPDGYAPFTLPAHYAVLAGDGSIRDLGTEGDGYPIEHPTQAASRAVRQEGASDLVWWRRTAYFGQAPFVIALVALPYLGLSPERCNLATCGVGRVIGWVGAVLPGFLAQWIDFYAARPGLFLALIAPLILLIAIGTRLEVAVRDRMRDVWRPFLAAPGVPVDEPPAQGGFVFRLRTHPAYRATTNALRRVIMPAIAGLVALAGIVALVIEIFRPA